MSDLRNPSDAPLSGAALSDVIGRAAELQRDAELRDEDATSSSVAEVKEIARELDIEPEFVERALEERAAESAPAQPKLDAPPAASTKGHDEPARWWRYTTVAALVAAAAASVAACVIALREPRGGGVAGEPEQTHSSANDPRPPTEPSARSSPSVSPRAPEAPPMPIPMPMPTPTSSPAVPAIPTIDPSASPSPSAEPPRDDEELPATPPMDPRTERVVPPLPTLPPSGYLTLEPLPTAEALALESRLQGTWQLDGYSVLDRGAGTRIAVVPRPPQPGERLETWWFRPGHRFEHAMRGGPSFSGEFHLTHRVKAAQGLGLQSRSGGRHLLKNGPVTSSLGTSWDTVFYLAELPTGDAPLVLYYLGRTITTEPPPAQGSRFSRTR